MTLCVHQNMSVFNLANYFSIAKLRVLPIVLRLQYIRYLTKINGGEAYYYNVIFLTVFNDMIYSHFLGSRVLFKTCSSDHSW